ncbi:hypothetical protein HanRHA438_Chr01g0018661 [Helianthus annuus]|nr:hypothetical protein HanRHA438_Chr01g0018661 [Helianthus annuus]
MALRGKEETFVRRFTAGGNDGVPFNPRGYGDHSRRFAARGNEIVDHENFRESCDGYHPRRFAARGNEDPDLIYDSSPVFDEYEDDLWYAWATGGSYRCGFDEAVRLNENSLSPKIAEVSRKDYLWVTKALNESDDESDEFSRDETDNNGGCVVDIVGRVVAIGAHAAGDVGLETPLFPPIVVEGLNTLKDKVGLNFDISIIDEISRKNNNDIYVNMEEHQGYKGYGDKKKNDHLQSGNPCAHEDFVYNFQSSSHFNYGKDLETKVALVGESKKGDRLYRLLTNIVGLIYMSSGCTILEDYQKIKKSHGLMGVTSTELQPEPLVNTQIQFGSRFNAPFDPGGLGQELGKTKRAVKFFGWGVIIVIQVRVDVPYDPGGLGLKAKLEDEFFSKRGRMMQEHISISYISI